MKSIKKEHQDLKKEHVKNPDQKACTEFSYWIRCQGYNNLGMYGWELEGKQYTDRELYKKYLKAKTK